MKMRTATQTDYKAIDELIKNYGESKKTPDYRELQLVHKLRESENYLSEFEYIMEKDGEIIGYIMLTSQPVETEKKPLKALLIAPLCIKPEHAGKGYGAMLLRHAMDNARIIGYGAAFLLGSEKFYRRFQFVQTRCFGIENLTEYPNENLLCAELRPGALWHIKGKIKTLG